MVIMCRSINILKRVLCLLLIAVLLFCFFFCPRAQAVALEATTIAYGGLLVGTILVGAGVVFSSRGDMAKVGAAMYKTLVNGSSAIGKTISSISAWAVEHGKSIGSAALRIGKDLYQGIVDAFNVSYSADTGFSGGKVYSIPSDATDDEIQSVVDLFAGKDITSFWYSQASWSLSQPFYYRVSGSVYTMVGHYEDGSEYLRDINVGSETVENVYYSLERSGIWLYISFNVVTRGNHYSQDYATSVNFAPSFSRYAFKVPAQVGDLAYPSDNYLVKMPDIPSVDTATGEVTYPDSIAYTKDAVAAPYPIGDDGVKVPDIPFDIPVDQTSGKPMDDTGTDTDTPSKPGTDTPSDTVNWPSASDLSLPKLIISKFPFSIPFDVANMIALLEADPKAPVFKMPLKVGSMVDEEIVLDLEQFSDVIRIIRWGELILFVAGLAYVTRNYIKW